LPPNIPLEGRGFVATCQKGTDAQQGGIGSVLLVGEVADGRIDVGLAGRQLLREREEPDRE